jgi:hypothetical protein
MQPVANIPIINGNFYKLAYQGRIIPYIKESVFCSFGKNYFSSFIDMWADSEPVTSQEIFHTEESEQVWKFRPAQNVSGAPGMPVAIPIRGADHYLGGGYSHVQPGFLVAFPPIGKMGRVTAVDTSVSGGHVATVVPFDSAYAINVTTSQDIIIIPIQIRKPGSCDEGNSTSTIPGLTYKSRLMIATKDLKIEGSDLAMWTEDIFTVKTRSVLNPCEEVDVLWHNDLDQMLLEFTQGWSMAFMMAEEVANPHVDIQGYGGTTGYLHALRARGSYHTYAQADGLAILDFDVMSDKIKAKRGYCTEYGVWSGMIARRNIDDDFGERFGQGQISYGTFQGSQEKAIDFGFQSFVKNGIEWHLHEEASFNDPGFLGAAGFNGPNMSIALPLCQMQCGNETTTPLKINYLASEKAGYSREFEQWDHGVLKPDSNNSTCDWHAWHLRSEKGFQMYCPEHHWLIEGL